MTSNQTPKPAGRTATAPFVSDTAARERIRLAQKRESERLRGYMAATKRVAAEVAKRAAALRVHDSLIAEANEVLDEAITELVAVSGFERASILIDQPEQALRAAVRSHRARVEASGARQS